MYILNVDKDGESADTIRAALIQAFGDTCRVDSAQTFAEALRYLRDGDAGYDAVLTELFLPDGDGLSLLTEIRRRWNALAVVIVTDSGSEETAAACFRFGADDYLPKRDDFLVRLPGTLSAALQRCGRISNPWSLSDEDSIGVAKLVQGPTGPVISALEQEHRNALEAMRESLSLLGMSEERNRAILAAVPDLLFIQDRDGTFRDYHARDPSILLVPPDQFLGRNVRDVMPPGLADALFAGFEQAMVSDEPAIVEYSVPIGGAERHYEARIVRCNGDQLMSVVRDITDRKRAEEALRRSEALLRKSHRRARDLAGKLILAQEEERQRISRDIHDNLNQKVALLALAVSQIWRTRPAEAAHLLDGPLDDLQKRAIDLADDLRRVSHDLHPPALEYAGLSAALEGHCDEFRRATGIRVALMIPPHGTPPLPPDIALCLYRITQEALRNVARHARTDYVEVSVIVDGKDARLWIRDGGAGFDHEGARRRGRGLGLLSMEERVRLLQGDISFDTALGRGTTLRVTVPLRSTEPDAM